MGKETLSTDDRRATVERVCASTVFKRSHKLREFLAYVSKMTVGDSIRPVHEQDIGHHVFNRPEGYSTSEDNIVRVEARRLRKKLDEYYQKDGRDDKVRVSIPKGSYAPVFSLAPLESESLPDQPADGAPRPSRPSLAWVVGLLLAGVLAGAVLRSFPSGASVDPVVGPLVKSPISWPNMFVGERETFIVLADASFVTLQDYLNVPFSLAHYQRWDLDELTAPPEPNEAVASAARLLASRQFTSVTDAVLVGRIMQIPGVQADRVAVRSARHITVRDLMDRNLILLGSKRSNPWVEMFGEQLNFRFEFDPEHFREFIRNIRPLPGEDSIYMTTSEESYGGVALVPNLNKTGRVLIIAGTGTRGTEAAGHLFANRESWADTAERLGLVRDGRLSNFEIIVRTSTRGGATGAPEILAHRVLPQNPEGAAEYSANDELQ